MVIYYKAFKHKNISDGEEEVIRITSTSEEKKRIVSVLIQQESNEGTMKAYIERENIMEYISGVSNIQNFIEIPVNADLEIGEEFKITLKNNSAGVSAEIIGMVKYEIVS